jgi:hypothetical protein
MNADSPDSRISFLIETAVAEQDQLHRSEDSHRLLYEIILPRIESGYSAESPETIADLITFAEDHQHVPGGIKAIMIAVLLEVTAAWSETKDDDIFSLLIQLTGVASDNFGLEFNGFEELSKPDEGYLEAIQAMSEENRSDQT